MPELPEVETTRRGIARHILGQEVIGVTVRERRLRRLVPPDLVDGLPGCLITAVERRGKYLLLRAAKGTVILHLGMSGSLRIVERGVLPERHDHVDIVFVSGVCLRFRDPRRFGLVLWVPGDPLAHELLRAIGPEPLGADFNGGYLHQAARGRQLAVKHFLMDARIVAGVGNIYANEALYHAGIHPLRQSGRISRERYDRLAMEIRRVLEAAVAQGGTTLRDFCKEDGEPGYFVLDLKVYGREGRPCSICESAIRKIRQGQRASYYCVKCQS